MSTFKSVSLTIILIVLGVALLIWSAEAGERKRDQKLIDCIKATNNNVEFCVKI